ncbi:MAG: hypothetical protein O7B35_11640 [Deltaproteobacteria bacterium]|nr:hypothetical protein [Deltaproteobacteria bacterium]
MSQEQVATEGQAPLLHGYLTKGELARAINRSARTIERWHSARIGPPRIVVGRMILYKTDSVRAWLQANEKGVRRGRNGRK